jgi:hypothetical protein
MAQHLASGKVQVKAIITCLELPKHCAICS